MYKLGKSIVVLVLIGIDYKFRICYYEGFYKSLNNDM